MGTYCQTLLYTPENMIRNHIVLDIYKNPRSFIFLFLVIVLNFVYME